MLSAATPVHQELWSQVLRDAGQYGALMVVATACLIALCKFGIAPIASNVARAAATHRESVVEAKNSAICARDAAQASERSSEHSRQSSEHARKSAEASERIAERILARGGGV